MRISHLRLLSCIALSGLLAACAGDNPSGPGSSSITAIPGSPSVRGASLFDLTVRGVSASDSVEVRIASTAAWSQRLSDSLFSVMMPGGPAGSVVVEVRVQNANGLRTASATMSRLESATVANPVAYVDSVRTQLGAEVSAIEALPVPEGVPPEEFGNYVSDARLLADSATTLLNALSPGERVAAAAIIADIERAHASQAGIRAFGSAFRSFDLPGALANSTAAECNTNREEAAICLAALVVALRYDIAQLVLGGLISTAGYAFLATPGLQLVGAAVGVYGAAKIGLTLIAMYEKTERAVFGPSIFRTLALGGPASTDAALIEASSVASLTVNPDVPVALPLSLSTSNPLPSDSTASPLVAELAPIFLTIAQVRAEILGRFADLFDLAAPELPTSIVRTAAGPVGVSELQVVGVSDPSVNVTLEDQGGTPAIRITGDPGAGKDVTVRIEADGGDYGAAELQLNVRYESQPFSLQAVDFTDWGPCTTWTWYTDPTCNPVSFLNLSVDGNGVYFLRADFTLRYIGPRPPTSLIVPVRYDVAGASEAPVYEYAYAPQGAAGVMAITDSTLLLRVYVPQTAWGPAPDGLTCLAPSSPVSGSLAFQVQVQESLSAVVSAAIPMHPVAVAASSLPGCAP